MILLTARILAGLAILFGLLHPIFLGHICSSGNLTTLAGILLITQLLPETRLTGTLSRADLIVKRFHKVRYNKTSH